MKNLVACECTGATRWCVVIIVCLAVSAAIGAEGDKAKDKGYRGQLGPTNKKIRVDGNKTYLWADGDVNSADSEWYDYTGSPMPAEELQFGIGKDRIRSIDDPLYVDPDDPRLLKIPGSRYRRTERPKTNDEIPVIGFAVGGEARAYSIALLDHHEFVNDRIGGKPVTVGW